MKYNKNNGKHWIWGNSWKKQSREVFLLKKVLIKILKNSQENTCIRVPFLIKFADLKRDPVAGTFLWFLKNFSKYHFYKTPPVAAFKVTGSDQLTNTAWKVSFRSFSGPYSLRTRKNTEQKNSEYEYFSHSVISIWMWHWPVTRKLAHDGGPYHVETSPLFCRANQRTGFYMTGTFVMKELKSTKNLLKCYRH